MQRTTEFDAFGPWIDEVHTVGDLPRLYRHAGIDPSAHHLVLKVPRNIERRDANPGLHLYDHLLAVDSEHLTVLSRHHDVYDTRRVPLDRIVAIEDSVRLLDGRLTIRTVDGEAVEVSYNGSANGPVRNLIRVLRQWYLPDTPPPDDVPAPAEPHLGREDTGLLTEYRKIAAVEPGLRLLNVGARQAVIPVAWTERLYRKVWPLTLHASIAVTDDREIQVLHRSTWFTTNGSVTGGQDLSLARTVLPRSRITAIHVTPHARYQGIHVVLVESGATRLQFPVTAGPTTTAILNGS